jgi:hypothetical protein
MVFGESIAITKLFILLQMETVVVVGPSGFGARVGVLLLAFYINFIIKHFQLIGDLSTLYF